MIETLEKKRAIALLKASVSTVNLGGHSRAINIEANTAGGTASPFHSESNGLGHNSPVGRPVSGSNTPVNRQVN